MDVKSNLLNIIFFIRLMQNKYKWCTLCSNYPGIADILVKWQVFSNCCRQFWNAEFLEMK